MSEQADRDALSRVILGRICNVTNLPDWMQAPALGRRMGPLATLIIDTILASDWLAQRDRRVAAGALRRFADSRGVNVGDEDDDYWRGYRQAQRECLHDAVSVADRIEKGER